MMRKSGLYKDEVKRFKDDLIENLIDWHIDITDFNVIKPFIIKNIESAWKGDIADLKSYLANTNNCTIYEIENFLDKSKVNNWPDFFKNSKAYEADDFQIKNNLLLKRVVFLDNEKEEVRRRLKEVEFCVLHHFKRSMKCNNIGECNVLYQISRFSLCCCWQSYVWRLVCYHCTRSSVIENYYENKDNVSNKLSMSCCFMTHLFCWPFHLCYFYDRINFKKDEEITYEIETDNFNNFNNEKFDQNDYKVASNATNSEEFSVEINDLEISHVDENSGNEPQEVNNSEGIIITEQPLINGIPKFHYTNKYFKSFLYIAIEGKAESSGDENKEFYFWIKIPFYFNIDLDDNRDSDLL